MPWTQNVIAVALTPRSLAASARVIFRFAIHSENIISSLLLVIYNYVISRLVFLVKICMMFFWGLRRITDGEYGE